MKNLKSYKPASPIASDATRTGSGYKSGVDRIVGMKERAVPQMGDFFMFKNISTRTIATAGGLSALSALSQLNHVGYQSPTWGMWVDVVAVSWIVAYFMFGTRVGMIVSFVGAIVITLFAPDTWLGASMKLVATIPIILSFALIHHRSQKSKSGFDDPKSLLLPLILGVLIRCLLVLPLNYFYAIPIWTKMTPLEAWTNIPWYVIVAFNIVQSIVDVGLAWVLVYKFKLSRYSKFDQTVI